MQNIVLSLLMDVLMAGLLLATMIYCWRLNARIRVLQDSRSELARIIREFDESTQRATESIAEIHRATSRLSENIQHKIDKANFLADDLELMIARGSKLVGKAEATPAPPARPGAAPAMPAPLRERPLAGEQARTPAAAEADLRDPKLRSRAEQELLNALSGKLKPQD